MTTPQNDPMKDALTDKAKIEQLEERLKIVSQLLTVAIAKLGGEMAATTTEIERSIMGQNIALTSLPNDRGYYAALVTADTGGAG
jgi:hypothetical protein